ncbi:hypothetical protein M514_08072 [Trichuris suis]|uniref:Uncharacterized protein n=1 Tax=Trichuris suis TaxID=68888 RepID=A0A085M1D5_9BILA|nr:hypothetical protein M513_08072 [Trichuris suis]KFD73245.1 hypothetical protein M514_08072 [Trichuris suis]
MYIIGVLEKWMTATSQLADTKRHDTYSATVRKEIQLEMVESIDRVLSDLHSLSLCENSVHTQ